MIRRAVTVPLMLVALLLVWAVPATAATLDEKLAVLSGWTQTSAGSYTAWNDARLDRDHWASYRFDWSTDHCSASPDQPLGFDFRLSCHRHDFGYRNYKAASRFPATKARLDNAFYADLKRRCAGYAAPLRPSCLSLAWTYYNAVRVFGSLDSVDAADLDRAARLSPAAP